MYGLYLNIIKIFHVTEAQYKVIDVFHIDKIISYYIQ